MGEAQDYQNALEEAYNTHWQNKVLLHPDVERAKRLLARGEFPDYEDICREILLVEYPEEVPHESAEDFDELSWDYILDDVFASNMAKGIQMWRRLLDIAEPALKTDAKTAEKLLPDWDWLDSPSHDQVLLLLTALDDERFASQLFESASIGRLQYDVLNACRDCGQEKLGQHCLELALKNPYLEENWEKRFRRVFTTTLPSGSTKPRSHATVKPIADTKPDDGTVYHYCSVQVQGTRRPYAYLTGGLPLKVGDWVELPFGKDDVPRHGQVKAVMDCTRMVAPWPPEQTKTVIRTIDAPAVTPTTEVAAPESQKRVEQPKKKTESVEIPVISAPETKAEESKAEPQVIEPVVSEKDEEKPVPPKKPFSLGKLIAAVLAVAVIAGISISVSSRNKQRTAAYGDLARYIEYNNFEIIQSQIYSVFDMLYQGYAEQRRAYLQKHKRVSEYDSENLMYSVIQEVLSDEEFSSIGCAVHFSLATLVKDYEPLTEEERKYARNPLTHVDFLLFNQMDKQPVLAIEVDGGSHKSGSKQAERDAKKNSILDKCAIPLLRLRTDGSGEKEKIRNALKRE